MSDENVIRREFPAVLEPTGDGRTLELRIVPHGSTARVSDDGGRTFYEEEWVRGVFRNKDNSPKKVLVNIEHERGFGAVVGRGTAFQDSEDGFDGSFRMLAGPDGDKALELVNEGVLTGVSVEAIPIKSERTASGLVRRLSAKLLNVSLCRSPAFPQAQVLAVREQPKPTWTVNIGTDTAATTSPKHYLVGQAGPELFVPNTAGAIVAQREEPDPSPEPPQPEPPPDDGNEAALNEVLERLGYEPLVHRAIVDKPWDGSAARFEDDEYQRSCLVCRPGEESPKTRCSLPVLEPNGDLNRNGVHAAAGRLNQASLSPELKSRAARKLVRYYRQLDEEPPPALVAMAGR